MNSFKARIKQDQFPKFCNYLKGWSQTGANFCVKAAFVFILEEKIQ